jgi:hypothetical protein
VNVTTVLCLDVNIGYLVILGFLRGLGNYGFQLRRSGIKKPPLGRFDVLASTIRGDVVLNDMIQPWNGVIDWCLLRLAQLKRGDAEYPLNG